MAAPTRTGRRRVTFRLTARVGDEVFVAGDFNGWNPTGLPLRDRKGDGSFERIAYLAPGRYEYKFVLNGDWCVDPNCTEWSHNAMGSLNSVLVVD